MGTARERVIAGAFLACVLVACGSERGVDPAAPQPQTTAPDEPVPDSPGGLPPGGGEDQGPQRVEQRGGLVDPRPLAWERAKVVRGGKAVDLVFWDGVEDCYGVARVEVEYRPRLIEVSLFGGRDPDAEVCIELALKKVIRVELEEPLAGRRIVDGSSPG